ITKDIDWLIEGIESAGMKLLDVTVVNRSDYSNDTDLLSKYPFIRVIEENDLRKEASNPSIGDADIVFSSARIPGDVIQIPIPMVQEDDPFFAIRYFTKAARRLMAPEEPGWRKDVVRP
ncbi:MAG: hypothetical protein J6Y18_02260, partial [Candidatus Methanomethylophilaceae archaeon]|nr:hypothetical protein [Candidatus Methanomethylophilaceae archaeon]